MEIRMLEYFAAEFGEVIKVTLFFCVPVCNDP
jgi:hypothetical protein